MLQDWNIWHKTELLSALFGQRFFLSPEHAKNVPCGRKTFLSRIHVLNSFLSKCQTMYTLHGNYFLVPFDKFVTHLSSACNDQACQYSYRNDPRVTSIRIKQFSIGLWQPFLHHSHYISDVHFRCSFTTNETSVVPDRLIDMFFNFT